MSTEGDRLVLTEYAEWRDVRLGMREPSNVPAFLAERDAKFNVSRIANALTILNAAMPRFDVDRDTTLLVGDMYVTLAQVHEILEGDRPFIEETTITGPTTRTYL